MEKLLSSKNTGNDVTISIKNVTIGEKRKTVISGPCSIENLDMMMTTSKKLKDIGVDILRGGAFKPRTSPYDFQGLEMEGLKILKTVSDELKMPVVSEIMDTRDIESSIQYLDIVQIGSRNMFNYSLLKEIGKYDIPVILKRGMSATIEEWLYAAEYILSEGNSKVILCERGIRTFETYTRNTLDLNSVVAIKQKYRLPVLVDPSHGTGLRELVRPMSRAAIIAGADGIMVESHIYPDNAISDARQTVSIECVSKIIKDTRLLEKYIDEFE